MSISNTGMARVYDYDSATQLWVQRGQSLVGNNASDHAAEDIGMNAAGTRVAVGAGGTQAACTRCASSTTGTPLPPRAGARLRLEPRARAWCKSGRRSSASSATNTLVSTSSFSKDGRRLIVHTPNYDCNYLTTDDHHQGHDCGNAGRVYIFERNERRATGSPRLAHHRSVPQ